MDSIVTYQKRLQDEIAAVENEIKTCHQQIETLNKRLEGLKRALELFDSDQTAITELLRTSTQAANGTWNIPKSAASPALRASARKAQSRSASPKLGASPKAHRALRTRKQKSSQERLDVHTANQNGKAKRTDLIAAVLRATPDLTVQDLIKALKKEFGWKCTESNLTGHLYTNPKLFTHTKADRSGDNPVRWSLA